MTNAPDDPASGRTPVIGLTGPIGCGKTTVAGWLADRGAVVVDADVVAREMTAPGQPAHDAILSLFGDGVRATDSTLDRAALARVVFRDPVYLAQLEAIVHPVVRPRILELVAEAVEGRGSGRRDRGHQARRGRPVADLRRGPARDLRSGRPARADVVDRSDPGRRRCPDGRPGGNDGAASARRHARHRHSGPSRRPRARRRHGQCGEPQRTASCEMRSSRM